MEKRKLGEQKSAGMKGGSSVRALIITLIALAAIVVLSFTTNVLEIFAPVVNSGSAIIAFAFVAGLIVYRLIRNRKKKE